MKLELESPTSQAELTKNTANDDAHLSEMLKAGIKAAQEGNRAEARQFLFCVTESQSDNETAWLWLASISEYPEELLGFLNNVLRINPQNERAVKWSKATKSLMAKTLVQRGITASHDNQIDFARQFFRQALSHDSDNELAWLWLASIADSSEEKTSYLEKVLAINPKNETAQNSLRAVAHQNAQAILKKANVQAIAGDHETARQLLEEVMNTASDLEEAWILKAYLSDGYDEKIKCFEQVLKLNPKNETAQAGIDSLHAIKQRELDSISQKAPFEESAEEVQTVTEQEPLRSHFTEAAEQFVAQTENMSDEELSNTPTQELDNKVAEKATQEFTPQVENFEDEESDIIEFQSESESEEVAEKVEEVQEIRAQDEEILVHDDEDIKEFKAEQSETVVSEKVEKVSETDSITDSTTEVSSQEPVDFSSQDKVEPVQEFSNQDEVESVQEFFNKPQEEVVQEFSFESAPETESHIAEKLESFENTDFNGTPSQAFFTENHLTETQFSETHFTEEVLKEETFEAAQEESAETFVETPKKVSAHRHTHQPEPFPCPFCFAMNESQAFNCYSCRAVLTLTDFDMLLNNQDADADLLNEFVEKLENKSQQTSLDTAELTKLGIAYLNLKELQKGYSYLNTASQLNPNNVVFASQVHTLSIRLKEIEMLNRKNAKTRQRTILVVDDSATVRKLISGKLEKCGHKVVLAVDGMDALAKISEVTPDLVLLDITMPRLDGYQVCKLIRNNDVTKDIPVVMISGKDGFFDKVRGKMAGSTGYITKPFGPDTLMKTLDTYF